MSKSLPVNERCGFQFRAEAHDFPNHPNLNQSGTTYMPVLNAASSQFGMITGKSNLQRTLQLSLRFSL